jgi:very-short-patch-repair endonuclease
LTINNALVFHLETVGLINFAEHNSNIMSKTYTQVDLWKGSRTSTFRNAKYLRQNTTEAEETLWKFLRNRNLNRCKFRRQHPLGSFVADFYCHESQLVVEVDGGYHNLVDQQAYDKWRTEELAQMGISVIRFTNEQVEKDLNGVLAEIRSHLTPDPSPARRGG